VINFVFQSIQSTVPIQTDARPRIEFIAREPQDRELVLLLNSMLESDWETKKWDQVLLEAVYDKEFYGASIGGLTWDADAAYGTGEICWRTEDPFNVYPDPDARDVNTEAQYFITAEPMSLDKVKRLWPDKKDFIKPDVLDLIDDVRSSLRKERFRRPSNDYMPMESMRSNTSELKDDYVLVITCYWKCEEKEESLKVELDEGETPQEIFEQKKKYPNGRKTIIANNVVLEDGPNPYEDGLFPYQRVVNYVLPREFWGISEVEQLESPQKIFNKLISYALDVMTLMGNPIWIVDTGAGIDTSELHNRPGMIVEKAPGSEVRREEGTQLQPYVLQLIDRMQSWFNDIAGTSDVSRGVTPGSVTAASAILALQESALTRMRQKSRNIDAFLRDVGRQYASRALQYYDAPRVFRVTNDQGAEQYFKAYTTTDDGERKVILQAEGELVPIEIPLAKAPTLDVKVSTGSQLPFAKAERENRAYQLFDRGIIDAEEVLKITEYPNATQVLERLQAKAQAAAGAPPSEVAPGA
jgi:hypothetical protein